MYAGGDILGIGLGEFIVILLVAFLIVGPEDLPKVVRTLACWVKIIRGTVKNISESFEKNVENEGFVQADATFKTNMSHVDSEFNKIQKQVLDDIRKEGAS